jgi:hypothetical protein
MTTNDVGVQTAIQQHKWMILLVNDWIDHHNDPQVLEWQWAALRRYQEDRSPQKWKSFYHTTHKAKRIFFNARIKEISKTNQHPWDLMEWVFFYFYFYFLRSKIYNAGLICSPQAPMPG